MIIGKVIHELRKSKGLTQYQLAQKFHISQSDIARYERDKKLPSIDILMKYSDFFHVPIDYILSVTDIAATSTDIAKSYHHVIYQAIDAKITPEELLDFVMIIKKKLDEIQKDY